MILNPYVYASSGPAPSCTWDPSHVDVLAALSNLNLTALRTGSGDSGYSAGIANVGQSTGKRMFEIVADSANFPPSMLLGVANASQPTNSYVGSDTNGWSWNGNNGLYYYNSGNPATSPGINYTTGSVIGFYVDFTVGMMWISRDGTPNRGADTIGNTGQFDFSGLSGTLFPAFSFTKNSSPAHQVTLRAMSSDVQYPVSGFTPWGDP